MARDKVSLEYYIGYRKKLAYPQKTIKIGKIVSFVILLMFCLVWVFPFLIMFFGSLRGYRDTMLYPRELFYPHSGYTFENF